MPVIDCALDLPTSLAQAGSRGSRTTSPGVGGDAPCVGAAGRGCGTSASGRDADVARPRTRRL